MSRKSHRNLTCLKVLFSHVTKKQTKTRLGRWIIARTTHTPTQYRIHRRARMSDLECRVLDNLQYELLERLQRGKRVMTYDQWQQNKEKIISLCERKKSLLEERNEYVPLPAKLERKFGAQLHKMKVKDDRKVEAGQQEKDRREIKAKKAKDKETEKCAGTGKRGAAKEQKRTEGATKNQERE